MAGNLLREGLKILAEHRSLNLSASLVPHASYSLSPQLLKGIYSYSDGQFQTIHHRETASEKELFKNPNGDLAKLFLVKI